MTLQPTQSTFDPAIPSFSGFDDLGGIDDARDVRGRTTSALEKLLEVCEGVIKQGEREKWSEFFVASGFDRHGVGDRIYNSIYRRLKDVNLKHVFFTGDDLIYFISAKANNDYGEPGSFALGLFTGCLLHLLTIRNRAQGRRTRFYINGQGNKFDYLFCGAREVDELIVDNFNGSHLCTHVGSFNGHVDYVVIMNSSGERLGSNIGSDHGEINNVIFINTNGESTALCIGSPFDSNKTKIRKNQIGNVIIVNNYGEDVAWSVGFGSYVNNVIIINADGLSGGQGIGSHLGFKGKVIRLLIYPQYNLRKEDYGTPMPEAKHIYLHDNALTEYSRLTSGHTIDELIEVANKMNGGYEEQYLNMLYGMIPPTLKRVSGCKHK
ncbi:hypothetical protein J4434_03760 [Candidatus Woesearchaeota archaeon]|nr:hypothetical protein [Candidatus Woesearchaeota archaeon]